MRNILENTITLSVAGVSLILSSIWYYQAREIEPLIGIVASASILLTGLIHRIFPTKKDENLALTVLHKQNVIENSRVEANQNVIVGNQNTLVQNFVTSTDANYTLHSGTSLPFPKPAPHIPRRIFEKKKDSTLIELLAKGRESSDLVHELEQHNYIVLLGEAGMGKSTELEWFCYLLHESEQYIPVYKKLSIHHDFMVELPSFDRAIEERIVLVLDGLDETNMLSTKQRIEKFVENHPKAKVLVSCRSNAYADTLRNFKTYVLGKLPPEEIQSYVREKLGPFSETFFNYC